MIHLREPLESLTVSLFVLLWCVVCAIGNPLAKQHHVQNPYFRLEPEGKSCLFQKSLEGEYTYVSPDGFEATTTCALYIDAEPEYIVEFQFLRFEIGCLKGGKISVIDGWELGGQFLPGIDEHPKPLGNRFIEFCGTRKPWEPFTTSQNIGAILFKIPTRGEYFKVLVTFRKNPKPCNVLLKPIPVSEEPAVYTLRNYGQRGNCSVAVIYPMSFRILAVSIGSQGMLTSPNAELETGIIRKCMKRGMTDYVEFKGGDDIDNDVMVVVEDVCGLDSSPSKRSVEIPCSLSLIRLTSSGHYDNSITFGFTPLDWDSRQYCSSVSV